MKEKRDRLFKRGRPLVREFHVFDGDKLHLDMGLLWVSYTKGEFFWDFPKGMNKEEFADSVVKLASQTEMFMVDDYNDEFGKIGPIGVVVVRGNGWKIRPHTVIFPWATARNKLRCTVAFFQMARYKKIGVCIVESLFDSKPLFDKCVEYGVLKYLSLIHI